MKETAQVLEEAADLLDVEGGWCQGRMHVRDHSEVITSSCLVGGVRRAILGEEPMVRRPTHEGAVAVADAVDCVRTYLSVYGVVDWNDSPKRTQGEVVDVLRQAAKDLRNK